MGAVMKRVVVACQMMEAELNNVYAKLGCKLPIVWIEKGYHNTPDKLREKLQETIDGLQEYDEILMVYALCGNGMENIVSPHATLIIPRFDDCINMLLCTGERKSRGLTEADVLYLTKGWIDDEEAVIKKHEQMIEEYDEETAQDILEMMYAHYQRVLVIDTGSEDQQEIRQYAEKVAELLQLKAGEIKGTVQIIEQLLCGEWDNNFIIQEAGQKVLASQWNYCS